MNTTFFRALLVSGVALSFLTFTGCERTTETEVETGADGTTEVETETEFEAGLPEEMDGDTARVIAEDVVDGAVDVADSAGAALERAGDALGDAEDDGAGQ